MWVGGGGTCSDPEFVKYNLIISGIATISWIEDLLRFEKHTCIFFV